MIVDASRTAVQIIERNAQNVVKQDFEARVRILKSDYRSAIGLLDGRVFDLVFLDPPYRMTEAYADALLRLNAARCLSPDCLVVLERQKAVAVPMGEGFISYDTRFYGETAVEFLKLAQK